jgi:hypothetical protein
MVNVMTQSPIDRAALRQVLVKGFSLGELKDLAFDMGVDDDLFGPLGKGGFARELIAYLQKAGQLDDLVAMVERLRPTGALVYQ